MLNVDYKILAKVFMLRMKKVMADLVHPDQTCAVPQRDMRDGLLSLYNVTETIHLEGSFGLLLSVDHMSAFDVIEWEYVFETLSSFGFGPNFVKWVKSIYSFGKIKSSV